VRRTGDDDGVVAAARETGDGPHGPRRRTQGLEGRHSCEVGPQAQLPVGVVPARVQHPAWELGGGTWVAMKWLDTQ